MLYYNVNIHRYIYIYRYNYLNKNLIFLINKKIYSVKKYYLTIKKKVFKI